MDNIIISGCSYSYPNPHSYGKWLGDRVINLSFPGSSNPSILYKVWEYIRANECKGDTFVIQLTYLHRIGWYHQSAGRWIDWQPVFTTPKPNGKEWKWDASQSHPNLHQRDTNLSDVDSEMLSSMYKNWLSLVYDEEEEFRYLMYLVDSLSALISQTGNKAVWLYWPHISTPTELVKRGFFEIGGQFSLLKWSTDSDLLGSDSHLSDIGCKVLGERLRQKLGIGGNLWI